MPALSEYRADIAGLAKLCAEDENAVLVCKHDYVPKNERKFLGQVQTRYARKNWSSLMLFNNARGSSLILDTNALSAFVDGDARVGEVLRAGRARGHSRDRAGRVPLRNFRVQAPLGLRSLAGVAAASLRGSCGNGPDCGAYAALRVALKRSGRPKELVASVHRPGSGAELEERYDE